MLIASARMAALKAKDSIDCSSTSRRIGRLVTITSAVWAATEIVNEKYRKSVSFGWNAGSSSGNFSPADGRWRW